MKSIVLFFSCSIFSLPLFSQTATERLQAAYRKFESDSQLKHAISSLYVINAKTGEVVFEKNPEIGLAPASTQKIIIAATAFELLGKNFRYQTPFGYIGKIKGRILQGNFFVKSSGDPTLGSSRWQRTKDSNVIDEITAHIRKLSIVRYNDIVIDSSGWDGEVIPDGWIWQDVGNYYGAGAAGFNWKENQFDIVLRSGGKIADPVTIVKTIPPAQVPLISRVTSAAKGSGDNAYAYYPLDHSDLVVRGTIPINETAFVISAANPYAPSQFRQLFRTNLAKKLGISQMAYQNHSSDTTILFSHLSPALDSIIYWFLKKSINLYGEALLKTIAYKKSGHGSTDNGITILQDFWRQHGLDAAEINVNDGSGLSPLNRVTTHAEVEVLKFAKARPWFADFFNAFPEYNNMKIKSGTITDVKSFCGYHTSGDGTQYIFSFIVNNYAGASSAMVQKMYKVLDVLK